MDDQPDIQTDEAGEKFVRIDVKHEKSRYFRTVRADGAFAGLNISGDLQLTVYSERPSLPKEVMINWYQDGKQLVAPEDEFWTARTSFDRELEIVLSLSLSSALKIKAVLETQIEKMIELQRTEAEKSL